MYFRGKKTIGVIMAGLMASSSFSIPTMALAEEVTGGYNVTPVPVSDVIDLTTSTDVTNTGDVIAPSEGVETPSKGESTDPITPAPSEGEDPVKPDPETPSEPSTPGEGEDPVDPTPDEPTDPVDPSPIDPTPTPDQPSDPVVPDDPKDPVTPEPEQKPTETPEATPTPAPAPAPQPAQPKTDVQQTIVKAFEKTQRTNRQAASNVVTNGASIKINHFSTDLTTEKFIASIAEQAREIGQENNLYSSVMIAQAVLESGSGNSQLAKTPYNNLFGIKGTYNGNGVSFNTMEDDGTGAHYGTRATFRAYSNTAESLQDYADLLRKDMGDYYKAAWKENAATPADAAVALQGTYATDTDYAQKLMDIINTYDLTEYDKPLEVQAKDANINYARTISAVVSNATSLRDVPYVWGGESYAEGGFDCSGLVLFSYTNGRDGVATVAGENGEHKLIDTLKLKENNEPKNEQATKIVNNMNDINDLDVPRVADDQANWAAEDVQMDVEHLLPGDTLYWADSTGYVTHTALYLGRGYFIEETGDHCQIRSLEEHTPSFAKRFIPVEKITEEQAKNNTEITRNELADEENDVVKSHSEYRQAFEDAKKAAQE